MRAGHDSGLLRWSTIAYLCLTAVFAVVACLAALRDQMTVLFADDWRMLDHYQSRSLFAYLFGSENGHRLPATLALFAIDQEWLGGTGRMLVLVSIACALIAAGLFARFFWKQGGLDRAPAGSALGFACFALFWAVSCNDLLRGIYEMTLQTLVLLLLALTALAEVDVRRIRASRGRLGLAALAASVATWSHGVGVAVWAALVAVAAVRRLPARCVAGLAALGAAMITLYAATLPPDPKNSFGDSLALVAWEPVEPTVMALAFLGSAPARVASGLGVGTPYPPELQLERWEAHTRDLQRTAVVFGALGLLQFAIVAARRSRRPAGGPMLDSLSVGLMAFAVAAALLVSFVRCPTEGSSGVLHARFLLWSTLFWVGGVCALAGRARERDLPLAALLVIGLPLLSAAMLPALRDARDYHAATRSHASKLDLALLLGLHLDPLAQSVALEDAQLVYRVASRLEAERRAPFEGARYGLRGSPLEGRFAPAAPCSGTLERRREIPPIGAAAVAGWLACPPGRAPPDFVVLVDEGGVIRGLADLASAPPFASAGARDDALAWSGFIADYDPAQRYAPYAVLADGRDASLLRGP